MDNESDKMEHPYRKYKKLDFQLFDYGLVSIDENRGEAVMRHPGFSVDDFDKDEQPKIWNLMSWVITCRDFLYQQVVNPITQEKFLDMNRLVLDRMIFMKSAEFILTKNMYCHRLIKRPLFMKVKRGYIGSTTFSTIAELRTTSGELLMTNDNLVIGVDIVTRKPIPLPEWYIKKHTHRNQVPPLIASKFNRPGHVGCHTLSVQWTDLDGNEHATWYTYILMTLNAASLSVKTGLIKNFRQNKLRGLHRLQMLFLGESVDGDNLDVYVWEETHNVLKSDICKNGTPIFQGVFQFFEN